MKKLFQRIHDYGGKIVCTVTTARHAHAAIEAGADALSVIGYEAGRPWEPCLHAGVDAFHR